MNSKTQMTRRQMKLSLYKLALARSDFFASRKACEYMVKHVDGFGHPLYYHLYASSVVSYAKPFVDSALGVLPSRWGKFEHAWMRDVHNDVIRARHEVIAHNDQTARKLSIVPPGAAPDDIVPMSRIGIALKLDTYYISGGFFSSLGQVCEYQIKRLNKAIDDALDILYEGRELPSESFVLTLDDEL
ncbi:MULTISPECIES: hypothetical protein [Xanthomonas]|uniref:hypothetical protein n=1 Tax=Xanthomonas TaxID=338 RepID=UPI0012636720|nr:MULTISPECIES: hypothetical protein [Xanthomonas]MCW0423511.1 hypothetical protein [Xanthomonas sacchari]MCW0437871.1 hypothetical protein [Xanthomonas sacchari]MCW0451260.1 hypothetical protein [Xanthomonas sacchari]